MVEVRGWWRGRVLEIVVTGSIVKTGLAIAVTVIVSATNSLPWTLFVSQIVPEMNKFLFSNLLYPSFRLCQWVSRPCLLCFVSAFSSSLLSDFETKPEQLEQTSQCPWPELPSLSCKVWGWSRTMLWIVSAVPPSELFAASLVLSFRLLVCRHPGHRNPARQTCRHNRTELKYF